MGKHLFHTWKTVFGNWRYLAMGIIAIGIFYSFNVLLANWNAVFSFLATQGPVQTLGLFSALVIGFRTTISSHSFVSLIVLSIMFGMLVSLLLFKSRAQLQTSSNKVGFVGGAGVFLATLAPGCAACGIGLASALGLGAGFLAIFPYDGLELSIFAIGILGFTIVKVSKDLTRCNSCQIKLSHNEK